MLNIYFVVAHKREVGLVQGGDTLKIGTLGIYVLEGQACLCGGDPIVEQGTVPTHQSH